MQLLKVAPIFLMRRSNRNFNNPPPPPANPGHLTGEAFPGVGNLTFASVGWGKLDRKCQVSNDRAPMEEMEEFKGRDIAFVSDWLPNKVFKSSLQSNFGCVISFFLIY